MRVSEEELNVIVARGVLVRIKCFKPPRFLQHTHNQVEYCTVVKRIICDGNDIYEFRHIIRRLRGHK